LQSSQTKRYDVAYEVIVPSGMDADALVALMNLIAVPGSSASQAFRQVLTSTDGIAQVGKIVVKIPARKFEENATTPPGSKPESLEEENSWTALVVGAVAIFMALFCGTTTALLLRRKMQPPVPGQNVDAETHKSLDGVILPGQDVDAEAGNGAILLGQEVDADAGNGPSLLGQDVHAEAGKGEEVDAEGGNGLDEGANLSEAGLAGPAWRAELGWAGLPGQEVNAEAGKGQEVVDEVPVEGIGVIFKSKSLQQL